MQEISPLPSLSDGPTIVRPAAIERAAAAKRSASFAPALDGMGGVRSDRNGLGERFEAAVLTPFLAAMLPPDDSMVWGGTAGKMWRGLFAQELAAATARSGGVGIGSMIDEAVAARAAPNQGEEG